MPSVPNVLGSVADYDELLELAAHGGLGDDLVVQLPWGDSGKTTFFITDRASLGRGAAAEHELTGVELKVMKRINCRAVAVEAVLTRHGTLVGPIMADITGYAELTPVQGRLGRQRRLPRRARPRPAGPGARVLTQNLGDRLANEGYRGFFEVDYLVDIDTGELYLGELNPRLSGISSMTNVTAGAYAELPLFLFHLLEYLDVDYVIDVDEINARWADPDSVDVWSQVVIKQTGDGIGVITTRPQTGIWRTGRAGELVFDRAGHRLARPAGRRRGLLPARRRPRRLPLQGRRHRHPGQPGAAAVQLRLPAHPAVPALDQRDPQPGAGDTVARHADPGRGRRHEVTISEGRRARAAAGRGRAPRRCPGTPRSWPPPRPGREPTVPTTSASSSAGRPTGGSM